MFASIKSKLWELLKEKEVSLAMLYNREGEILWHRGRPIEGKSAHDGCGFCRSYIQESFQHASAIEEEYAVLCGEHSEMSNSARVLHVKSLIIQPIGCQFFLYIDSGTKQSFSASDIRLFRFIGGLLQETIIQVRQSEQDVGGISGSSQEIQHIRDLVLKYSLEEEPVLLLGETGVGKSRIAELIHRYSGRKGKFFTVHTPSIPENLLESEIFGHRQGAFTDARHDRKGYVDEAAGGTIFFDEISEIAMPFQAKLLRFIETRKYLTLGESGEKEADVRIVTATNRNLLQAIQASQFREDLFYRLQVLTIEIPPLRQRREDIRGLVKENWKLLRGKEVAKEFWEVILAYDWPGNTRELLTVLTRAGIDAPNPITGQSLHHLIGDQGAMPALAYSSDWTEKAHSALRAGKSFWDALWNPFIHRDLNREQLRQFLGNEYLAAGSKLKGLAENLHINASEFKKFISVLHKYAIHPKKEY